MSRDLCYLSKGERSLLERALLNFIHQQHVMIQQAHAKYATKDRKMFEVHQRDHKQQIDAAEALKERFRSGDVLTNSTTNQSKE